jgi:hypothetical protein
MVAIAKHWLFWFARCSYEHLWRALYNNNKYIDLIKTVLGECHPWNLSRHGFWFVVVWPSRLRLNFTGETPVPRDVPFFSLHGPAVGERCILGHDRYAISDIARFELIAIGN